MIKISHECPLQLLPWSKTINDYEYILPYFYRRSEEYKEFYLQCKAEGRFSILDNGLFEGETYTKNELVDLINEVKPDIFIVPDEWNDFQKTYDNAKEWSETFVNPVSKLMVVLQGETFTEIKLLYNLCYNLGYRHFALNHSSVAYDKAFPHRNTLVSKMMGRIQLVDFMCERFRIDDVYVHLLGATLPQEFMYYKGYNFIKSIDTSNPILIGASGESYGRFGMLDKPKDKMEKFFDKDIMKHINTISENVRTFRELVNLSK
jgi:hypothetical protein